MEPGACLTHLPLGDVVVIFKVIIHNSSLDSRYKIAPK